MRYHAVSRPVAIGLCSVLLCSLMVLLGCGSGSPAAVDVAPKVAIKGESALPVVPRDVSTSEPLAVKHELKKEREKTVTTAPFESPTQKLLDAAVADIDKDGQAPPVTVPQVEQASAPERTLPVKDRAAKTVLVQKPAIKNQSAKTEAAKTESVKREPAKTAVAKFEPAKVEPAKPEPTKPEPIPVGPATSESTETEPVNGKKEKKEKKVDPSDEFFQKGMIPEIRITLTEKEEAQLRRDLRRYVDVSFTENETTTFKKVKMKLKGAAGSFRDLNDRPALTVSVRGKGERFHGMEKFHLNNSVQDESYLNELIASELCHDAGLPAARTTHARVWLNGRDLGFYVLKEGMDERFVKRHYQNAKGNFYDGAFCADIDAALEKEFGDGPDDRSDLKGVIDACREADQNLRWQRVEEKVAIDDFINFTAMELMLCHWDGYCQNRNNYRIYFPAEDQKIRFLPHGMDQMFGDINFGVFNVPGPIVANAVLQNPAVQLRYRQRVRELIPFFAPEKLHAKIDAAQARIRPVLAAIHEDRARQFDARVTDYKNRVAGRLQSIKSQFPPEPIAFNAKGWALLEDWEPKPQGDAKLETLESDGKKVLALTPGSSNQVQASFRTKVRLARGTYRLDAQAKTKDVVATPEDKGFGAGVRLGGGMRTNHVIGTTDWQTVSHEFEIGQDLQEVELVAELRSTAGSAQFDLASLRVYKLK
ncbi:MAG: hypothetical protein JWN70_3175 [Planctomycetaceae bacterium]|nr:hypothetical protein [Planctomycetaceae bacterium]